MSFAEAAQQAEGLGPATISRERKSLSFADAQAEIPEPKDWAEPWKKLWAKPGHHVPYLGAALDGADLKSLKASADRIQAGQGDQADEDAIFAFMLDATRDRTWGNVVSSILVELPSFAAEFYLTKGVYASASKATRTATKKAVAGALGNKIAAGAFAKGAGAVAGAAAGSAARTSPTRLFAETMRQQLPSMAMDAERASVVFEDRGRSFADAFSRAAPRVWAEYFSEQSGAALAKIPGAKGLRELQAKVFGRLFGKESKATKDALEKIASDAGWHGAIEEFGEERVNSALLAALTDEPWGDVIPSFKQGSAEIAAFTVPGAGMSLAARAAEKLKAATPAPGAAQEGDAQGDPPLEGQGEGSPTPEGQKDPVQVKPDAQPARTSTAPPHRDAAQAVADHLAGSGARGRVVNPKTQADLWAVQFEAARGRNLVLIESEDGSPLPRPASAGGGVTVLDANATSPAKALIFHEAVHGIPAGDRLKLVQQIQKDFPELWRVARANYETKFKAEQQKLPVNQRRALAPEALDEEGVARVAEDLHPLLDALFANPHELARLRESSPTLIDRIVDAVIRALNYVPGINLPESKARHLESLRRDVDELAATKSLSTEEFFRLGEMLKDGIELAQPVAEKVQPLNPGDHLEKGAAVEGGAADLSAPATQEPAGDGSQSPIAVLETSPPAEQARVAAKKKPVQGVGGASGTPAAVHPQDVSQPPPGQAAKSVAPSGEKSEGATANAPKKEQKKPDKKKASTPAPAKDTRKTPAEKRRAQALVSTEEGLRSQAEILGVPAEELGEALEDLQAESTRLQGLPGARAAEALEAWLERRLEGWALSEPVEEKSKPRKLSLETDPIWAFNATAYLSETGVHEPWIAEISPKQLGAMTKPAKARYEKKRAAEWGAATKAKREFSEKVIESFNAGEFTLETEGVSDEVKKIVRWAQRGLLERKKAEAWEAQLAANVLSFADLKKGQSVHHSAMGAGKITKVNKKSARFLPEGAGQDVLVYPGTVRALSYNALQEEFEATWKPPAPRRHAVAQSLDLDALLAEREKVRVMEPAAVKEAYDGRGKGQVLKDMQADITAVRAMPEMRERARIKKSQDAKRRLAFLRSTAPDLQALIRRSGGVIDENGDFARLAEDEGAHRRAFGESKLIQEKGSKKGVTLDRAIEIAIEADFFPGESPGSLSPQAFRDALEENPPLPESIAESLESAEDEARRAELEYWEQLEDELGEGRKFAVPVAGGIEDQIHQGLEAGGRMAMWLDVLKMDRAKREEVPDEAQLPHPTDAGADLLIQKWQEDRDASLERYNVAARFKEDRLMALVYGDQGFAKNLLGKVKRGIYESKLNLPANTEARDLALAMHIYIDLKDAEAQGHGSEIDTFWPQFDDPLNLEKEDLERMQGTQKSVEQLREASEYKRARIEQSQNLTAEQLLFVQEIIAENVALGQKAKDQEVIHSYKENYSARLYQPLPDDAVKSDTMGRFTLKTGRSEQREYTSILAAWADGRELQIESVIDAQAVARRQVAQVIHDRNLMLVGEAIGMLSTRYNSKDHPVRLNSTSFNKWERFGKIGWEGETYGADVHVSDDGTLFRRVPLYASETLGNELNKILDPSRLGDNDFLEGVTEWNAKIKATVLAVSLFHHQAFLRSFVFASPGSFRSNLNIRKAYREGGRMMREFGPMIQELVRGGLTIGRIQDIEVMRLQQASKIGKVIDKVPMLGTTKRALLRLVKHQLNFLFHHMGANLKVMTAMLEFQHQLKIHKKALESGEMQREEIARIVAEFTNADFGGLNLKRKTGSFGGRRSDTAQQAMRILFLAPDWTESNVLTMTKALKKGHEGAMYRAMWGRVFMRAGLTTVLFNYLMAMADDDDWSTRYKKAWDSGKLRWLDWDITPIHQALGGESGSRTYFSILGHFRDPIKWFYNDKPGQRGIVLPERALKHKASIFSGLILDAASGSDWADRPFTTWQEALGIDDKGLYKTTRRDPKGGYKHIKGTPKGGKAAGQTVVYRFGGPDHSLTFSQMPSFATNQVLGWLPIPAQNLMALLMGEMDGFSAMTKSMGFHTSQSREPWNQ